MLPDEPCGICYDEITSINLGKSKSCNHVFCHECLEKAVNINGKCPICREKTCAQQGIIGEAKDITGDKITFIKDLLSKGNNSNNYLVSQYRQTIETLREVFDKNVDNIISYNELEEIDTNQKTFIFLESLNDENKYIKYFTSGSKCIFLNIRP